MLNLGGNPIAPLFYAIGGAAIVVVDSCYSGRRRLVPRASRSRLLLAKFATFALFAALSLALVAAGDTIITVALPFARSERPTIVDARAGALVGLSLLIS